METGDDNLTAIAQATDNVAGEAPGAPWSCDAIDFARGLQHGPSRCSPPHAHSRKHRRPTHKLTHTISLAAAQLPRLTLAWPGRSRAQVRDHCWRRGSRTCQSQSTLLRHLWSPVPSITMHLPIAVLANFISKS